MQNKATQQKGREEPNSILGAADVETQSNEIERILKCNSKKYLYIEKMHTCTLKRCTSYLGQLPKNHQDRDILCHLKAKIKN